MNHTASFWFMRIDLLVAPNSEKRILFHAMRKLLIIIPNMNIGGAQKSLLAFFDSPALRNYKITVLLTVPGGALEEAIPPNVQVIHGFDYYALLDNPVGESIKTTILGALKRGDLATAAFKMRQGMYFKLRPRRHPEETVWRLVRSRVPPYLEDFDACIAYMQGSTSYFAIDKLPNVRRKFLEFNTDFVQAGYSVKFNRKYFAKADGIIAVTASEQQQLSRLFPDLSNQIYHIPYQLSIGEQHTTGVQAPSRNERHGNDGFVGIRIVSVGRLEVPAKGYDLLIESATRLRASGLAFRWYFVGPGSSTEIIRGLIRAAQLEEEVVLTGPVMDPFPLMKSSDIFVHGSRFEGVPRAVREAMALGLPVVTTNYPAAVEEFCHGHDCLITEMDSASIAEAIERLVADPELRAALGANATKNVSKSKFHYGMLLDQ